MKFIKLLIVSCIITGCTNTIKECKEYEKGYYWRDNYRHDYSNAPPVISCRDKHE